jgi:hypothetical protein
VPPGRAVGRGRWVVAHGVIMGAGHRQCHGHGGDPSPPWVGRLARGRVSRQADSQGSSFRLAMISGSLAAGLGHETSDLDIHVVLRPPATIKSHMVGEGTRVQFREIPESVTSATLEALTRPNSTTSGTSSPSCL